jgi:iron(III) transport system substrate-binding protein
MAFRNIERVRRAKAWLACVISAAFFVSPLAVRAESVALVQTAKSEGVVVWYATTNTNDMVLTANQFMKTHPGIKVQTLRLGSSQLPARVATEQRSGTYNADVISGDEFQVKQLIDAGAFQKYEPADTKPFIKGTIDPDGYWVNLYLATTVFAWNPQRLKADHLTPPTSVADFAKPQWKGKFGLDTGALNWYLGTVQTEKNGQDLVKALAGNDPQKTDGHTQTVTQLASGEFDATPTAYGYMADEQKHMGRPIGFSNPTPLLVTLNPIGLAKNAPHPAAAKVFIDWVLSKEGQQFIARRCGKISSRSDVQNNPSIWDPKHPFVVVQAPDSTQYNELEQTFRSLFGLP